MLFVYISRIVNIGTTCSQSSAVQDYGIQSYLYMYLVPKVSDKNQIQINHELFKLDLWASLKKVGLDISVSRKCRINIGCCWIGNLVNSKGAFGNGPCIAWYPISPGFSEIECILLGILAYLLYLLWIFSRPFLSRHKTTSKTDFFV